MPRSALSEEARVVKWFQEADPAKVEVVFGIVKEVMRSRAEASTPGVVSKKKPGRKKAQMKKVQVQEGASQRNLAGTGESVARVVKSLPQVPGE